MKANMLANRRRFLTLAIVGGAGTALLAACGAPPSPTAAPKAPEAAKPAAEPTKPAAAAPTPAPAAPTATPAPAAKPAEPTKPAAAAATPAAKPGAKKEVHWWAGAGNPLRDNAAKKIIEVFEQKNPTMTVKFVNQGDLGAVLKTSLAAGTGPDFSSGVYAPGDRQVLADANLILKLDDYYKQYNWPVMPWARKRMAYKGGTWGIPDEAEYIVVWYNKAVLDKAGVAVPKNHDELMTATRTIKDKLNIVPWGCANNRGLNTSWWLSGLVEAIMGVDNFEQIIFKGARWDQEGMLDAATRFADFFKQGYASKDGNAQDSERVTVNFATGRHAFWVTGTWNIKRFDDVKKKDMPSLEYDYIVYPPINSALPPRPVGGQGEGFLVSAKPRDLEAVMAWVTHYLSPETAKIKIEELAEVLPVTTLKPAEYNVTPITKKLLDTILAPQGLGYNIDGVQPLKQREYWFQGGQGLAAGDVSPKDYLTRLQQLWDEAKAEGKLWEP